MFAHKPSLGVLAIVGIGNDAALDLPVHPCSDAPCVEAGAVFESLAKAMPRSAVAGEVCEFDAAVDVGCEFVSHGKSPLVWFRYRREPECAIALHKALVRALYAGSSGCHVPQVDRKGQAKHRGDDAGFEEVAEKALHASTPN